MYQIKKLLFLLIIFLLSACYEVDMVIELNPDGSGVFKRSMNFNRATEDQKVKIKEFIKMSDGNGFSSELLKIEDNFPTPFFRIIKNEIDEENLTTYTEIEFQDINRLFAVDKKASGLKGVNFEVDKSHIIFTINRNNELINQKQTSKSSSIKSNPFESLTAKVTNTFISKSNNEKVETYYEFIGDDNNAVVNWQGQLEIPDHSISKTKIKQAFAKYPVLKPSSSHIKTATWVVSNDKSRNALELELLLPKPAIKDKTYLGYDEKYLLSGKYNDGTEISITKGRFASFDKFNSFSDTFVNEGSNFKVPINLSFPDNPVDFFDSLMVRIRVLSVKNSKRFELGKPVDGKTYQADSFKFTIESSEKTINITSDGPSHLFKQFLIQTPNGNMPIKPQSTYNKTYKFKNIPFFQNSIFLAEYYIDAKYEWLDSKVPRLDFSASNTKETKESFSLQKLFPEITKFPIVDDSIYKDLDSFKNYWAKVPENKVIPALLVVSNDLPKFQKEHKINSWYQRKLGKTIKEKEEFFNNNKQMISDSMFKLYLNKPNRRDNIAIIYFLNNLGLTDLFKEKALTAIKQGKLKSGYGVLFLPNMSQEEKDILKDAFYKTSHDWVENQSIFKILTKGDNPDLNLAKEVINSDNYHEYVRNNAFEVVLNYDKNISTEFIKPYLINIDTRQSTIKAIINKLFKNKPKGEITNEDLLDFIRPLKSLFEDIIQISSDYEAKDIRSILNAIDSVKAEPVK